VLWGAAVAQLQQMGGSVLGRKSLVRGSGLVVDVRVECSWCSHVEVFQHTLSTRWVPMLLAGSAASCALGGTKGVLLDGVLLKIAW
jgi:gamma-glutamyl:cysteine ligase YbdK (ATP-grasp superfamily)